MDNLMLSVTVVFAFTFIVVILIHNSIVKKFNNAKRGWSDVINYERNKLTLIPKLEESVKQYVQYEGSIMSDIVKLRNNINDLNNNEISLDSLHSTNVVTSQILDRIKLSVENYPDLKSASLYNQFIEEWSDACKNVAAAISIYNFCVLEFNNSIQIFPNSFINHLISKKNALKEFSDSVANSSFEYKPNFN